MTLRILVITIIVILAQGFSINLAAQDVSEMFVISDSLQVFFRQNKTTLDPQYRDNGSRLSDFTSRFNHLQADSTRQEQSNLIELTTDKPKHQSKPLRFAIESNLLYDAAVIPNIGVEIAVWRGLTVGASYQYIWMRNSSHTRWHRFEGTEATANWYFDTPFSGHHVGIYAQMCTWDFTINGRGYLAERWTYGGGISYGYNLPIAKRFSLDFEIGIGYLHGKMHRYTPQDTYRVWHSLKPFNWFGPTKLGVTLQWFIGRDNCNERRSGI